MTLTRINTKGETVTLTEEEEQALRNEWEQIETEKAAVEYKKKRELAYPKIGDQLDMLWHSMDTGEISKSVAFYDAIASVKAAHPKPQQ